MKLVIYAHTQNQSEFARIMEIVKHVSFSVFITHRIDVKMLPFFTIIEEPKKMSQDQY